MELHDLEFELLDGALILTPIFDRGIGNLVRFELSEFE